MNKFTINGKEYVAKAFDFNMVCDLEDMGVSLQEAEKKPMSMARAYFGLCANKGKEYAGKEIEAHLLNGGSFEDIITAMTTEMDKSDFFRGITKDTEQETTKNTAKTSKKAK